MKKVFSSMILFLLCIFIVANIYAVSSINANLTSSVEEVKENQELSIILKFENYNEVSKGIYSYKATLEYDKNIFDEVKSVDFVGLNDWSEIFYNPDTQEFIAIKKAGSKQAEEVMKINLKVKDKATPGVTTVSVKDIVCSDGEKDIDIKDTSKKIEVVKTTSDNNNNLDKNNSNNSNDSNNTNDPSNSSNTNSSSNNPTNTTTNNTANNVSNNTTNNVANNNTTNSNTNNVSNNTATNTNTNNANGSATNKTPNNTNTNRNTNTNTNTNTNRNTNTNKNTNTNTNTNSTSNNNSTTKPSGTIPKTGSNYTILFCLIVVEIAFVIISFVKYKDICKKEKMANKKVTMLVMVLFTVMVSTQIFGGAYSAYSAYSLKGELNSDDTINYVDANLLEKHLIHLQNLPEDKLENADMNSDGYLTVTDLSILVRKIEGLLEYTVDLSDIKLDNYYPNKNDEVTLSFHSNINYKADIKTITINDKEYTVENSANDEYLVKVTSSNKAGVQEFKMTKVLLDTGKEVDIDYTAKLAVQKQKPIITNYSLDESVHGKTYILFNVSDEDDSITSAQITVSKKQEDDSLENVVTQEIAKGNNKIEVNIEDGQNYQAKITLNYNLTPEQIENHEEDHTGVVEEIKEFQGNLDYQFTISNIESKTTLEKNEAIKISFESSNASSFEPSSVKVNGKEYTVTKEDNKYVATIDGFDKAGENTIKIDSVTLANGKEFALEKDNTINVTINKSTPSIKDFEAQESIEDKNIKVKFAIEDSDNTIQSAKVVIYDSQDNVIESKDLTAEEIANGKIETTLATAKSDKYKVKVIANYQTTELVENSTLFEKEIEAQVYANITNAVISKNCVEKSESIAITYTLDTNSQSEISKIRVNSVDYDVTKQEDGTYLVTVLAPETVGEYLLNTTKLIFANQVEVEVANELKVDVLKDIPTLQVTKQEDDLANDVVKIYYTITDEDGAYISSKAQLIKVSDNQEEMLEEADAEKNTAGDGVVGFKGIEENLDYIVRFVVTYNRHIEEQSETMNVDEKIDLIRDYNLQVSDIKTLNAENETQYFAKNENIIISFTSTNASTFIPEKAIINGDEYDITRNTDANTYQVELEGFDTAGAKEFKLETIILNNKKYLDLSDNNTCKVEIIKDEPVVKDFSYQLTDDDITVKFNLVDDDTAITNAKFIVTDSDNSELKNVKINAGENEITVDRTSSEMYNLKIVADYDLDTNTIETGKYEEKDKILLEDSIDTSARMIEMKDINNVTLYQVKDDSIEEITTVRDYELKENLSSYIVKVDMNDMPSFYAPIEEYLIPDLTTNPDTGIRKGTLKFKLKYDGNVVQYDGEETSNDLIVTYASISGGRSSMTAEKVSFESIIASMNNYPNGNITLTCDIDASGYKASQTDVWSPALVNSDYSGTFDGNGHTIYNLSSTIFSSLEGATIKNLVIENAVVETKQNYNSVNIINKALIANEAESTTFSNVHIKNSRLTTMYATDGYGMLVGELRSGTISNCSATNCVIKGDGTYVGGLVGTLNGGNITNSYMTGSIEYTESYSPSTPYIGGIAGYTEGTVNISNTIAKIETASTKGPSENGGLVGTAKGSATLTNNLSLSTGSQAYRLIGSSASSKSSNNYELEESTLLTNTSLGYVKEVSKADITSDFFEKKLKLNSNIWNFENASYDNLPTLKNLDPNNSNKEYGTSSNLYIPDYDRLSQLKAFKESKKIAYSNMYKLMPFYDAKYLVMDGNKIADNDVLNKKFIKSVLAYDSNHNLVVALTEENYKNIASIKVVFTDNTSKDYTVTFKDYYSQIATYKINELNVDYNYDAFVINQNSAIVTELVNYIQNIDYNKDLAGLHKVDYGGRIYRDYFNETIKANAKEFVLDYLANSSIGVATSDNEQATAILKKKLITDGELKQTLFAYNYYSRWYDIDINGASIVDMMLFKGRLYGNNMGIDELTVELMNSKWVNSPHVKYFYRDNLGPRTRISTVGDFIEYNVNTIGTYDNVDDWFTDSFKGVLYEAQPKDHPEIEYRAWTQLKKKDDYILALLTIPENSGYMVSFPTQFLVGSVKVYGVDASTEEGRATLLAKMKAFGDNFATMYNTTAGFLDKKYLNNNCDIQIDRTGGSVELNEKTTDPFIKNFNEAMYEWREINMGGQAAYGQDSKVFWVESAALNYYAIATHETGHNQAAKVFLENNGRRGGTTNTVDEDYPDGNINQTFGDGSTNFNLSYNYTTDSSVTTNLTPERIDTREKIESYYKEMFETIDFLDYAEAKAFLQLTPEEQSKVAVQVYYPRTEVEGYDSTKAKASDFAIVGWRTLTAEKFEAMNLKTIEDIYKNHITIKPGVKDNSTLSGEAGSYGSEGIYVRHWYQPHNDYGRTYSYGLKATAWEMLGVGGYEGYVTYYSGKSANDLDAIRKVTGDSTMTWEKYKLGRYQLMESKWNDSAYIDADELVEQYVKALKKDAQNSDRNVTESTNIRRINYNYLKRVTNDFRSEALGSTTNVVHITSAEDFISKVKSNPMGYFVLDNDIDFSTITDGNAIVTTTFSGIFDGNNHKIIGNKIAVFNTVKYADISNLHIVGNTAPVFNTVSFANITNIEIEDSNISSTAQDVGALAKSISNAKVENIKGSNIEVTSTNKEIGGFIGIMSNTTLTNIHITDSTVSGNSRVGGIAGYVGNITLDNSSSNNVTISSTGNATGGFIGEIINSSEIKNCFATGTVIGNQDIGGFVGYLNNSTVSNCYTFVTTSGNAGTGGFIGQAVGNSKVTNNIVLGNSKNVYKFDGRTASDQFAGYSNNYEYEEAKGNSTLSRTGIDFTGKIEVISKATYTTREFFMETLGWDSSIWDLSNVADEKLPRLKASPYYDDEEIIKTYTIANADEFIEKITAEPDGIFFITDDIDFSEKTFDDGSSVITETFSGKIEGNNHTISNLKEASLFNAFNGKISNLKISNFSHHYQTMIYKEKEIVNINKSYNSTNNVTAFAKSTNGASLSNISFDKMMLFGQNNVAVVSLNDTNSTFDRISVTDSFVVGRNADYGGGENISTFIAKANGSTITNCYVQGELRYANANKCGAIIGSATNVTIDKVISDVTIPSYSQDIVSGFVGAFVNDTTSQVKNSIVLGQVMGDDGQRKFVATSNGKDDSNINQVILRVFENCYEDGSIDQNSNSNDTTSEKIMVADDTELLDKDFYIDTLGFDEKIWNLDELRRVSYDRYQVWTDLNTIQIVNIGLK